jgi:putative membrane protein
MNLISQQPEVRDNARPSSSVLVPAVLLCIYAIIFILGAFAPYARDVWFAESATVWVVLIPLIIMYVKGVRFSNTAYILMSVFIIMHTIGAHYTFSRVPFDWFNDFFGFERNMYDRVAHFSVGFYALPIYEYMQSRAVIASKWVSGMFALFTIISIAAVYELFEWQYAMFADPAAGLEVLGSQGDIWDAQKDMLADTLGALTVLVYIAWYEMRSMYMKRAQKVQ